PRGHGRGGAAERREGRRAHGAAGRRDASRDEGRRRAPPRLSDGVHRHKRVTSERLWLRWSRPSLARRISVIPEWLRTSRGANDPARSRSFVPAGLLGSCRPRSAVDLVRRARELHTESIPTGFLAGLCGPRGFEPPESGPDARDVGERILFKPAYRGRSPASLRAQLPSP